MLQALRHREFDCGEEPLLPQRLQSSLAAYPDPQTKSWEQNDGGAKPRMSLSRSPGLREAASAAAEAEGDSKLPVPVSGHLQLVLGLLGLLGMKAGRTRSHKESINSRPRACLFPKNQHGGLSQKVAGLGLKLTTGGLGACECWMLRAKGGFEAFGFNSEGQQPLVQRSYHARGR